jgi:hypothetical protein
MDLPEPWERQEGETPIQFQAFCHYRDAPSRNERRGVAATAAALDLSPGRTMSWSNRNGWPDRAARWDDYQDAEWRGEVIRERHRVAQRYVRTARALQGKAIEAIRLLDANTLGAGEIVQLLRTARELELTVYGTLVPDEVGTGSVPIIINGDLMPPLEDTVVVPIRREDQHVRAIPS